MARPSEGQTHASKRSKVAPPLKTSNLAVKIAAVILLVLVIPPASLHCNSRLLSSFQPYIPRQARVWLPTILEDNITKKEIPLSPEALVEACYTHQYTSKIISLDPLVIYINNFTSNLEAEELINIGSPDFASSFISRSHGPNTLVSGRTSSSAPLPLTHPLVSCILKRARAFMGSMILPNEPFSIPQLVRYYPKQRYDLHTDFWPQHQVINDGSGRYFNRAASFFVFLRANCTGGETWFPKVDATYSSAERPASADDMQKWYGDTVVRDERDGESSGVKFKPIVGNAIFWVNLNGRGEGDRRVVHAGLPVEDGEKIGLNIWPRRIFGTENGNKENERKGAGWSGKWKE